MARPIPCSLPAPLTNVTRPLQFFENAMLHCDTQEILSNSREQTVPALHRFAKDCERLHLAESSRSRLTAIEPKLLLAKSNQPDASRKPGAIQADPQALAENLGCKRRS